MAFPTLGILDNFDRANESPLAGIWTGPIFSGENQLRLVGNQIEPIPSEGNSMTVASYGPNVEMYCTLTTTLDAGERVIFYFRGQTSGALVDSYRIQFRNLGGDYLVMIDEMVDNVVTQLGANIDPTGSRISGDKFGVEMIGSTITAYHDVGAGWVNLGSRTSSLYAGAGYLGVSLVGAVSVDDVGGGTIGATPLLFTRRATSRWG